MTDEQIGILLVFVAALLVFDVIRRFILACYYFADAIVEWIYRIGKKK
jgi:hypothetical protein